MLTQAGVLVCRPIHSYMLASLEQAVFMLFLTPCITRMLTPPHIAYPYMPHTGGPYSYSHASSSLDAVLARPFFRLPCSVVLAPPPVSAVGAVSITGMLIIVPHSAPQQVPYCSVVWCSITV